MSGSYLFCGRLCGRCHIIYCAPRRTHAEFQHEGAHERKSRDEVFQVVALPFGASMYTCILHGSAKYGRAQNPSLCTLSSGAFMFCLAPPC